MLKRVAILGLVACLLVGLVAAAAADDTVPRYDAIALNKELIGNEQKARSFRDRTIEVTGKFYGTNIVKPKEPGGKEATIVTFQGYADLGECLHIKCVFYDAKALMALKRGDKITVRGKVEVVKDYVIVEAQLVK